jgi:hypothetical protein
VLWLDRIASTLSYRPCREALDWRFRKTGRFECGKQATTLHLASLRRVGSVGGGGFVIEFDGGVLKGREREGEWGVVVGEVEREWERFKQAR